MFAGIRFWPLFGTQFFGALNDNFLKCAMLSLVSYKMKLPEGEDAVIASVASALFILPYFLFSALAGQLMDKYDRATLTRYLKITELILMILSFFALRSHMVKSLLILLFFMGAQSTFFGPAKYSLLPQHLTASELLKGNSYLEAGSYLAILTGTLFGSVIIMLPCGELLTGAMLVVFALIGYGTSRMIPVSPGPMPNLKIAPRFLSETFRLIGSFREQRFLFSCMIALSGFWLIATLAAAEVTAFCKMVLGGDQTVAAAFLILFSLGIAAGALLCNLVVHRKELLDRLSYAALLMAAASFGIAVLAWLPSYAGEMRNVWNILEFWRFYAAAGAMFTVAMGGGLLSIPLNTMLQRKTPKAEMARMVAANNILNAIAMAGGAIIAALLMKFCGIGLGGVFALVGLTAIGVALYCLRFRRV